MISSVVIAAIGIGSNLDDRAAQIKGAIGALDESSSIEVIRASSMIETDPLPPVSPLPPGSPPPSLSAIPPIPSDWPEQQGRYLNAAVLIRTTLSPRELLGICLAIERQFGRSRETEVRWGPRRLDLDLLLYGDRVINEPMLVVPHPRMHERRFVLEPLREIAPEMIHPQLKVTIECLLAGLSAPPREADECRRP